MSKSELLRQLNDCHDKLRHAQFDTALLHRIDKFDHAWKGLKQTNRTAYVQGRCVVAETYDYFGRYSSAAEALSGDDPNELEKLLPTASKLSTEARGLWKRIIWLVMAKAQIKYREERYMDAAELLELCNQATESLDPQAHALFGTRARLAYFFGQITRQRGLYPEAKRWFSQAVAWATKRFVADTPFVEIIEPVDQVLALPKRVQRRFDHARLLATWTIGKAQALGLGWVDLTTGNLASADIHLNAGYAMLRTTADWIHRAYSMLLLGVVERARAGNQPAGLNDAITRMREAKEGLSDHPFKLRACYELAQAYLRLRATDDARREIDEMLSGLPSDERSGSKQRRWRCNGTIVKSRVERIAGNLDQAENLARCAERWAARADQELKSDRHSEPWVEAVIARGEVLVERARLSTAERASQILKEALRCFEVARDHGSANPKTVSVCRLHLARVRFRLGEHRKAKEEYASALESSATVEHGFVRSLAHDVANEIRTDDSFFISSNLSFTDLSSASAQTLTADAAEARLHEFLARRAEELMGTKQKGSDLIEVDPRTARRWKTASRTS
jgi:tetratricopeptide (TPR) repeat protein